MAIVKETTKVFFQGINFELIKGNEVKDSSPLVQAKPELFEATSKAPKVKKATVEKVEEIKLEEKVEAPKEELLIEEPVAELEVTEVEEPVAELEVTEVEEEKSRRRRKS